MWRLLWIVILVTHNIAVGSPRWPIKVDQAMKVWIQCAQASSVPQLQGPILPFLCPVSIPFHLPLPLFIHHSVPFTTPTGHCARCTCFCRPVEIFWLSCRCTWAMLCCSYFIVLSATGGPCILLAQSLVRSWAKILWCQLLNQFYETLINFTRVYVGVNVILISKLKFLQSKYMHYTHY